MANSSESREEKIVLRKRKDSIPRCKERRYKPIIIITGDERNSNNPVCGRRKSVGRSSELRQKRLEKPTRGQTSREASDAAPRDV